MKAEHEFISMRGTCFAHPAHPLRQLRHRVCPVAGQKKRLHNFHLHVQCLEAHLKKATPGNRLIWRSLPSPEGAPSSITETNLSPVFQSWAASSRSWPATGDGSEEERAIPGRGHHRAWESCKQRLPGSSCHRAEILVDCAFP